MGFDMTIIKAKREVIDLTCKKYYVDTIDDLPYLGIVEIQNELTTKCFESRLHLLSSFELEGYIGYANETYTEISPELFAPIIKYCENAIKELRTDQRLHDEYKRLYDYIVNLKFNIEEDILLYEYNC